MTAGATGATGVVVAVTAAAAIAGTGARAASRARAASSSVDGWRAAKLTRRVIAPTPVVVWRVQLKVVETIAASAATAARVATVISDKICDFIPQILGRPDEAQRFG